MSENPTNFKLRPLGSPRRLSVYSVVGNLNSAQAYYRIVTPLKTAEELDLLDYFVDGRDGLDADDGARLSKYSASDLHLYTLLTDPRLIKRIKTFHDMEPGWDHFTKREIRAPSVVYDADDDVEQIDAYNPRFGDLGTHFEGNLLRYGDQIKIPMGNGEHRVMWKDGRIYGDGTRCDWRRNRKRLEIFKALVRMADGATCTTPNMAAVFRGYGSQNVYVFPNSIRFRDYPEFEVKRQNPNEVRILWQGGTSHWRDWYPLRDALARVSLKYDHVKFIIWGKMYNWVHRAIPPTRREHIDWMPHDAYLLKLSTLSHDINLAPLDDNRFNRCKSAIKFYESSAIYRPAASLVQDVAPYQEVIEGETGMRFKDPDEFEEKLCTLIEDATLRKRLGENAKQWVKENRDAEKTVPRLIEWYRSMR